MTNNTLIVNFIGGPSAGKSTMAAHVFALLKWKDVNCELVTEYAKDKTWEGSFGVLQHQEYVFGKQLFRISRLENHVEAILTDAPLLHSLVYANERTSPEFRSFVLSEHNKRNNLNILLTRVKKYNPKGRSQNEEEARQIDAEIKSTLDMWRIPYMELEATPEAANDLAQEILLRLITNIS